MTAASPMQLMCHDSRVLGSQVALIFIVPDRSPKQAGKFRYVTSIHWLVATSGLNPTFLPCSYERRLGSEWGLLNIPNHVAISDLGTPEAASFRLNAFWSPPCMIPLSNQNSGWPLNILGEIIPAYAGTFLVNSDGGRV